VPGVEGEYVATIPYNRTGRFELRLDPLNGQPASLPFTVTYPDHHELAPAPLAEDALTRLAFASRDGTEEGFYREEHLIKLPDAVQTQLAPLSRRQELLLWNRWMLLAIIALLTAEWVLRRFQGLS